MSNISKLIKSCRVSSVLNKDVGSFGKAYIYDGKEDTCWNSDKGIPQWVNFEFAECISIEAVEIQFQGGFVGSHCEIQVRAENDVFTQNLYPEDNNSLQKFSLSQPCNATSVKLTFCKSTDFFGRIVIYNITFI